MESQPFVSLIILENYHPRPEFIRCMKSLTTQNYKNYEIILILYSKKNPNTIKKLFEDNSIDDTRITIYEYEENLGYAKGNNVGVKKTNSDLILISNPDIETSQDFIQKMIKSYSNLVNINKSDKILLGPRICNYDGIIEYSRRKINFLCFSNIDITKTNKIRRTMITSGCSFLIKKKLFEDLNGFDESYFLYHEDIDFSIRASLMGIKQYVDNSIRLYHLRSDDDYRLTKFKYYYHERNRIKMSLEHTKKKTKMLICHLFFEPFHIIFALKKGFLTERIRIYSYFTHNLTSILKNKEKVNDIFDRNYRMDGIFNEVNPKSFIFKCIDFLAKCLFYFYHK